MKRKHESKNDNSDTERKLKKRKKEKAKMKKEKKKKDKIKEEKRPKEKKKDKKKSCKRNMEEINDDALANMKRMVPMTKEEWEKQQSVVRRVYDEDTGRVRLVKGSGEILEECVSKERQQAINKQATQADGQSFQKDLIKKL